MSGTAASQAVRADRFHDGRLTLLQPAGGHRAGLDALLLAATLQAGQKGAVADFGAASGIVGFAAARRCSGATVACVERDPALVELANQALALPDNAGFAARVTAVRCDLADRAVLRHRAGLKPRSFDHVLTNPPYQDASQRTSPNPARRAAHAFAPGDWTAWTRAAADALRARGSLTAILRPRNLTDWLDALGTRFGGATVLPLHPREGEAASRILVRAVLGSRADLALLPSRTLHLPDGTWQPWAEAVLRGDASIDMETV